jgi:hypothetical protein
MDRWMDVSSFGYVITVFIVETQPSPSFILRVTIFRKLISLIERLEDIFLYPGL